MTHSSSKLLQGTVDILILKILSNQSLHGYAMSRWLREKTDATLVLEDAALYQALHRMEEKGWIDPAWGTSETGRRVKKYTLTQEGRTRLESESVGWRQYADAVLKVIGQE